MKAPFRTAAHVALAAALLGACTSTGQNTYIGVLGDTQLIQERRNSLLARRLSITNVRSRWESERLTVQFELSNNRSKTLDIEWTVDWYDRTGFVVEVRSSWQPLRLDARSQVPILITAPSADAVTWKLHVRESQPVR